MKQEKPSTGLKAKWQKFTRHKYGKWARAWVLPLGTQLSTPQFFLLVIGTLGLNALTAPLLPTLEDKAEEYNLNDDAIKSLDPHGKVVVRDDSVLAQVHAATKFPGLMGIAFNFYANYGHGAYTVRSLSPLDHFFSDATLDKIGGHCVFDINRVSHFLRDNAKNAEDGTELSRSTSYAYLAVFHEIRHCAEDQVDNPYREMEANYYAEKAMEIQFGRSFGSEIDSRFLGSVEYDYTLYKDFMDRGLPLPSHAALKQANREAFDFINREILQPANDKAEQDSPETVDAPENSAPAPVENNEEAQNAEAPAAENITLLDYVGETFDFSTKIKRLEISELGKRRIAHAAYQMTIGFQPGLDYRLNDDLSATIIAEDVRKPANQRQKPALSAPGA